MPNRSAFYQLLLALLCFVSSHVCAQDTRISGSYNSSLEAFLNEVTSTHPVDFYYLDEWIENIQVNGDFRNETLERVINKSLRGSGISLIIYDPTTYVLVNKSMPVQIKGASGRDRSAVVKIGSTSLNPQKKAQLLAGNILDGRDGSPLFGATIYSEEASKGTATDENGFFSIILPAGKQQLKISSVGYQDEWVNVDFQSAGKFQIELYEDLTQLETVVITAKAPDENVKDVTIGKEELNIETIKKIPRFLGEIDVIKSLTTLPGVSTVGEGAAGFNVRGGGVGNNLVHQDGVMVFGSSHLFGFFSGFNPDLVEDVTLYKGAMPPAVGGRTSSVLNVQLKDDASEGLSVKGGVGLISSRLAVESPIGKSDHSIIIGGRLSYVDWILRKSQDQDIKKSSAGFGDTNAKLNLQLGEHDKLTLSGYYSADRFSLASDTTYRWNTTTASAKWDHVFSEQLFGSLMLSTGNFGNQVEDHIGDDQFDYVSDINYSTLNMDVSWILPRNHKVDFGISSLFYTFKPGQLIPGAENVNLQGQTIQDEYANESAMYVGDTWEINDRLSLAYGLRYVNFLNYGPRDVYMYDEGVPKSAQTINDTIRFDSFETIKNYGGLEPRASLRYSAWENGSLKISYNRTQQFVHLVSNTVAVTPIDLWQPSNYYIPPERAHQYSFGVFQNFSNDAIETSAEVFYKESTDMVDFKGGAQLQLNPNIEADLVQGDGQAYGLELLLKKKTGKLTGWISYTYSRSLIKVQGEFPEEQVNNGEYYPTSFDKPHDMTVVFNYQFTKRIGISANFNYSTGRPITVPTSKYRVSPINFVLDYSTRNQYRIPDYHRLDLSLTIGQELKKSQRFKSEFVLGLYNVYGRKNTYSIYFDQQGQAFSLSVLGTVFPSLSYNFYFK